MRQHPDLPDTFYVDVELAGLHDRPTSRGVVWMEGMQMPEGKLLLPDSLIEVYGLSKAPMLDQVAGGTLPRLSVAVWQDLTSEFAHCRHVDVEAMIPTPERYRWEN